MSFDPLPLLSRVVSAREPRAAKKRLMQTKSAYAEAMVRAFGEVEEQEEHHQAHLPTPAVELYRYGASLRPPGYASTPDGHVAIEPRSEAWPFETRHGIVVYERPLTDDETSRYNLTPYAPLAETVARLAKVMGDSYPRYRKIGQGAVHNAFLRALERLNVYTDLPKEQVIAAAIAKLDKLEKWEGQYQQDQQAKQERQRAAAAEDLEPLEFEPVTDALAELGAVAPKYKITRTPLWPENLPTEQRIFYIPVTALPKLKELATEHRVGLEIAPLDPRSLARTFAANAGAYGSPYAATPELADLAPYMPAAEQLAADYVRITLSFPRVDNAIIATAELVETGDGPPMAALKGDDGYWTKERIGSLDFTRCDRCGVRHARKYVYIVSQPTGEILQVGGRCAELMNLGTMLKQILKGITEIIKFIKEQDYPDFDESGGGGKGHGGRWSLPMYLMVLDQVLSVLPYESGSKHYERYGTRGGTGYDAATILYDAATNTRLRQVVAKIVEAYRDSDRLAWLLATINHDIATKQATDEGAKHGANMALAAATGRMPGYLAASIFRARKASDAATDWLTSAPVLGFGDGLLSQHPPSNTFAEVAKLADSMGMTLEEFAAHYGVAPEKIATARTKNKDFPVPFAKVSRPLPGLWAVAAAFSFEGDFGVSYMARLVRLSDRRYLMTSGGGVRELERGDVVRVWSYSGEKDERAYQDRYTGFRWPATVRVNRVEVEKVEGVPVPALQGSVPPAPALGLKAEDFRV